MPGERIRHVGSSPAVGRRTIDPPRFIGPSTKTTYIPVSASTDFPQLFLITATSLQVYILYFTFLVNYVNHHIPHNKILRHQLCSTQCHAFLLVLYINKPFSHLYFKFHLFTSLLLIYYNADTLSELHPN